MSTTPQLDKRAALLLPPHVTGSWNEGLLPSLLLTSQVNLPLPHCLQLPPWHQAEGNGKKKMARGPASTCLWPGPNLPWQTPRERAVQPGQSRALSSGCPTKPLLAKLHLNSGPRESLAAVLQNQNAGESSLPKDISGDTKTASPPESLIRHGQEPGSLLEVQSLGKTQAELNWF